MNSYEAEQYAGHYRQEMERTAEQQRLMAAMRKANRQHRKRPIRALVCFITTLIPRR